MRVFVAGIIQGSETGALIHDQGYRIDIARGLGQVLPNVEFIDPHNRHPDRFGLGEAAKRQLFLEYVGIAASVDLLIAYLPAASMGSAIEMFSAHTSGVPILTVTTMPDNWVILSLSAKIFTNVDQLVAFAGRPGFQRWLKDHRNRAAGTRCL